MSIQKSVQTTHNTGRPMKPAVLPLSSVQEVDCFEDIDDDIYSKVVSEKEIILLFTFNIVAPGCFHRRPPRRKGI